MNHRMNTKQIGLGAGIWTVGILVPLLYHAYLMDIASDETGYSYSFNNMTKLFFDLPWIVWPFLLAMTVVGTLVVIAGFRKPS